MKIVIDAMGGDNAPMEIVRGALLAAEDRNIQIILAGRGEDILRCLSEMGLGTLPENVEVANAADVITMEEDPIAAARYKTEASMTVAMRMLRDSGADAMVSAGSTGALLSCATLMLKRLRGVRRAALAPILPSKTGGLLLIDSGATADCSPEYFLQYARMGTVCARKTLRIPEPRVGLLNIGAEPTKGGALWREAYSLLDAAGKEGQFRFVGNMEAGTAICGGCDVLVADGMTGNVMLKTVEGMAELMLWEMDELLTKNGKSRLAEKLIFREMEDIRQRYDGREIGGTILLGVTKPVVKAHGSSGAKAVCTAIRQAVRLTKSGLIGELTAELNAGKSGREE